MNKKGQSALEYLMTYGWALVVIVIVIAALFAFGIFNPPAAGTCSGLDKLAYQDHAINNGVITIVMGNGAGSTITIDTANVGFGGDFTGAVIAADGVTSTGAASGADFNVTTTATGPTTSGSYSGTITILYTGSSGIQHTETATCTGSI